MAEPRPEQRIDLWPSCGRELMDRDHAIYTIATTLDALALGNWTHTLVLWLGQYDGLEQHLPPEHDPLLCVRQLLSQYTLRKVEVGRITVDLCEQPFLRLRAAWVDDKASTRRDWLPLRQAWLDFIDHAEPGEQLRVWESDQPFPSPEELRMHLLSGYVKQNGIR